MSLEETVVELQAKNHQLKQENNQLKATVGQLRTMLQSHNTLSDSTASRTRPSSLFRHTFDERQFRRDLQQTEPRFEHRTSSPVDFKSFLRSSVLRDTGEAAERQNGQNDAPHCVAAQPRMLGEIVFQLDRRILSHVFQAHKRLYGFTLLNIPEKIIEVSTHPLTGIVDEGYQFHLMQRYAELLNKLSQLGYKTALHPPFCEFIINSYGILKVKPSENSTQETECNDPNFLRRLIVNIAPKKLQKDLILVLDCLCYMAEQDGKPLLLW